MRWDRKSKAVSRIAVPFAAALACSLAVVVHLPPAGAGPRECVWIETRGGGIAFEIEVADAPEIISTGLMWRTELPENRGMLFLFDPPRRASFWMKNTLISLDMIFIDEDGRVHRIEHETEPLSLKSIPSGAPVRAVLEIAAGVADKAGVRPGDRVHHPDIGDSQPSRRIPMPELCR